MSQPRSHGSPSPAVGAAIVIGMLAMVVIPAGVTLHSVSAPGTLAVGADPSPHGYTWSLLLFIVPILVIAVWFLPSEGLEIPQRAFWRTIGILAPVGCLLDVIFAQWFFCFPNSKATVGIRAPALGQAGSDRGVCFLSDRLHHDPSAVCVAQRILAGGLHGGRLRQRGASVAAVAAVSSHVAGRWGSR